MFQVLATVLSSPVVHRSYDGRMRPLFAMVAQIQNTEWVSWVACGLVLLPILDHVTIEPMVGLG
jgi:hypothetical protein